MDDNATLAPEPMPALYAALAKAQGEFLPIAKNRTVTIKPREKPQYTFRYADLEAVLSATRPALTANGLSVIQMLRQTSDGPVLETILAHSSGAAISSTILMPRGDGGDIKNYGATITYLRRYAYCSLLCVAADDDLDENGEPPADDDKPHGKAEQKQQQQPRSTELPPYSDETLAQNTTSWREAIAAGRTTPARIIKMIQSKAVLSEDQIKTINSLAEE